MIQGIGCDIVEVKRFKKWISSPSMTKRFFNKEEILTGDYSTQRLCEHYAVRFAAKESFGKALGLGIKGFELTDIYIIKNKEGQPCLKVTGNALKIMDEKFGKNCNVHVSLSHEKEYAIAYVLIEQGVN